MQVYAGLYRAFMPYLYAVSLCQMFFCCAVRGAAAPPGVDIRLSRTTMIWEEYRGRAWAFLNALCWLMLGLCSALCWPQKPFEASAQGRSAWAVGLQLVSSAAWGRLGLSLAFSPLLYAWLYVGFYAVALCQKLQI